MAHHLTQHRKGFGRGTTAITRLDEPEDDTGIGLSIHNLDAGEGIEEEMARETAWLLMSGRVRVAVGGREATLSRGSLFDEMPSCLHVAAGERLRMECLAPVELDSFACANQKRFAPRIILPEKIRQESRGKGQVGESCLRFVRTIFDDTDSEPSTDLVLGEVITLPGRWSSYPPHHHPQPEIYHYRFTEPQGYGHAELGETVLKVGHHDTVKILDGNDHAQAAAPGYGMYYSWVIRHLPGKRYDVPEFTSAHTWTMRPDAKYWWPQGL